MAMLKIDKEKSFIKLRLYVCHSKLVNTSTQVYSTHFNVNTKVIVTCYKSPESKQNTHVKSFSCKID
jgi:hypothetical protein